MKKTSVLNFIEKIRDRPLIGIIIISAFYFFGIIGIISPYQDWFIEKTAFNLMLSFLIVVLYQQSHDLRLISAIIFCYVIGFFAEFLGVNYGLIFGSYNYPDTLGPQLKGVPLIIGINWFIITFCVGAVIFRLSKMPLVVKVLLATVLTVLIDVLIEPVAMKIDFWNWSNNEVPFQNYLGWAVISLLIFSFYALIKIPFKNIVAVVLLIWQILFFGVLNLFLDII